MFFSNTNTQTGRPGLIYKLLIFLAAWLLFSIQPMISKFILPWFGGSPSVWTTALLFFQLLLLAGYAFTHWLHSRNLYFQKFIYLLVLAAALLSLFWNWPEAQQISVTTEPIGQILLLLLTSIGLPYFVLAGVSPLLQAWFSRQPGRPSPYGLYVWSNTGSLLGLISYPIVVEPLWSLNQQRTLWYAFFVLLLAGLLYLLGRFRPDVSLASAELRPAESQSLAPNWRSRLGWLIWPLMASFLLLAVTNHITQDIAAVPLLWVWPLSLYLISFIWTFAGEKFYNRRFLSGLFLLSILSAVLVIGQSATVSIILMLMSMMLMLSVSCVVCHGELYRLRPASARLTEFYLWVSAGGALGGLLVLIVAPLLFNFYAELHVGLASILLLTFFIWRRQKVRIFPRHLLLSRLSLSLTLVISLSVLAFNLRGMVYGRTTFYRDFFGVLNIDDNSEYKTLGNGTTMHGLQFKAPDKSCLPTSYYGYDSGLGLAVGAWPDQPDLRLGVVGLGVGTAAVYGGQVRFYELNPQVEVIARQEFSYLSECGKDKDIEVVLGDARLSLAQEAKQNFDILVIDAFTSDAIPIHLLTREAFEIYLRHLKTGGVLAVHISNRYVSFKPLIGGLAENFDLKAAIVKTSGDSAQGTSTSIWALMSQDQNFFDELSEAGRIQPEDMSFSRRVLWTDKYSNIFTLLKWK